MVGFSYKSLKKNQVLFFFLQHTIYTYKPLISRVFHLSCKVLQVTASIIFCIKFGAFALLSISQKPFCEEASSSSQIQWCHIHSFAGLRVFLGVLCSLTPKLNILIFFYHIVLRNSSSFTRVVQASRSYLKKMRGGGKKHCMPFHKQFVWHYWFGILVTCFFG